MAEMREFPRKVADDALEALYRFGDEVYRNSERNSLREGAALFVRESTVLLKFFLDILDSLKGGGERRGGSLFDASNHGRGSKHIKRGQKLP